MPEELIPSLQELLTMLLNESQNDIDLNSAKPSRSFQNDRFKPEFSHLLFALDMYVWRFAPIQ